MPDLLYVDADGCLRVGERPADEPPPPAQEAPATQPGANGHRRQSAHASTPTPNVFYDVIAPRLPEAELRVMLYTIRRTFGFHREEDGISINQFCTGIVGIDGHRLDDGTGMRRAAVVRALAKLEARGLVVCERTTLAHGGAGPNRYRMTDLDAWGSIRKRLGVVSERD